MSAVTEAEAKQKWCPEARVSLYHRATDANRMVRYGEGADSEDYRAFDAATRCVGSGCMFWRWQADVTAELSGRHGYCGNAVKP